MKLCNRKSRMLNCIYLTLYSQRTPSALNWRQHMVCPTNLPDRYYLKEASQSCLSMPKLHCICLEVQYKANTKIMTYMWSQNALPMHCLNRLHIGVFTTTQHITHCTQCTWQKHAKRIQWNIFAFTLSSTLLKNAKTSDNNMSPYCNCISTCKCI